MKTPVFVGVDGCRAGWLCVSLDHGGAWDVHIYESIEPLIETWSAATILIDIPIGLPGRLTPVRACDQQLRRLLGPRRSSVFSPPCREALGCESYEEASRINRSIIGVGLSKQSWHIAPKIAQVDAYLRRMPHMRRRIRESHPEACFRILHKGTTLNYPKRTEEGFAERRSILQSWYCSSNEFIHAVLACFPRKMCARDDIVDALCLAVTARARKGAFRAIPRTPQYDSEGIAMMISY
jgi:predicted RNase H-like nuclease